MNLLSTRLSSTNQMRRLTANLKYRRLLWRVEATFIFPSSVLDRFQRLLKTTQQAAVYKHPLGAHPVTNLIASIHLPTKPPNLPPTSYLFSHLSKMSNPIFDGSTFFMYNKLHSNARCCINSNNMKLVALDGQLYPDQIWNLQASDVEGKYYIVNSHFPEYRLAVESHEKKLVVYNGPKYNDQIWDFEKANDDTYVIVNHERPDYRIAMTDAHGGIQMVAYNGKMYDDQKWRLVTQL